MNEPMPAPYNLFAHIFDLVLDDVPVNDRRIKSLFEALVRSGVIVTLPTEDEGDH